MGEFKIDKGLDLPLAGKPAQEIKNLLPAGKVALYPAEFPGVKPRLQIEVGDEVKRGSVLFSCKKRPELNFCSPAAGVVKEINLGERRSIDEIVVDTQPEDEAVEFTKYSRKDIQGMERENVLELLQQSGFLAFIRQRPFSRIASSHTRPKAIFVNAMNTAPFQADPEVVLQDSAEEFQAGLDLLGRLTLGTVYLSIPSDANASVLTDAENVEIHKFSGPHPSGNSSVHIAQLEPIAPGEVVWTVDARALALIGQLFLTGELPATQIVSLAGPGVVPEARAHYRIQRGGWLADLIRPNLAEGEQRLVSGDILMGDQVEAESGLKSLDWGVTVLPEERKREFLGWLAPGLNVFSTSRLFLSSWLRPRSKWALTTADHGSRRAMFATGVYDKVMPLNIMVDFLLRAVIAHDTDEAVQLGILETDPEDFALCSYICPSRTDVIGIVKQGLEEIEEEGIYSQE